MQIGNPLIRNYDQNINARMTEQTKGAEQAPQTRGTSDIASLSEGSVFRGEITDIQGERVTIATDDKGQVMARLQADMELNVGDQLLFSVKENNTSQVLIKPLFDSLYSAQTQVLERALSGTGLSPTEKNFSAAKELMDAGMSLDKANMVKLLSQSMKFEGTSMHTLAALNKMNIPVNAENIAQFERYQSLNHQLSGDISSVADGMGDFVSAFPQNSTGGELLSVASELMEIFNSEENAASDSNIDNAVNAKMADVTGEGSGNVINEQSNAQGNAVKSADNGTQIINADSQQTAGTDAIDKQAEGLSKNISEAMKALSEAVSSEKGDITSDKASANADNFVKAGGDVSDNKTVTATRVNDSEISQLKGDNNALLKDGLVKENSDSVKLSSSMLSDISDKTGLNKSEISNLTDMLRNANVSSGQIKNMFEQAGESKDLLKNIINELQQGSKSDQAVKNLLSSNEFKKLFSDMVKKEFALNPNDMKDPKEIDELYNKILKQTESFENTITAKGGDAGHFQNNSQNMQQNMQFMQELNNQMVYAQMPLKLSNQNANSELFVYADKRKLAGKRDDISVMLHLDMDHLGATDIKVTLTGTNVNARFYLNDKESVNIVADNMDQLAAKLVERGFSLTNEVVMRNPKETPNKVVNEFIDDNAEKSIKRFTFDAKT